MAHPGTWADSQREHVFGAREISGCDGRKENCVRAKIVVASAQWIEDYRGMQTSVRFSVSVSVGRQTLSVGSVRFAEASDAGQFSLSKRAVASGLVPGPLTKGGIVRAAAYLLKERAAVSCVCDGYTVSR